MPLQWDTVVQCHERFDIADGFLSLQKGLGFFQLMEVYSPFNEHHIYVVLLPVPAMKQLQINVILSNRGAGVILKEAVSYSAL